MNLKNPSLVPFYFEGVACWDTDLKKLVSGDFSISVLIVQLKSNCTQTAGQLSAVNRGGANTVGAVGDGWTDT